MWGSSAYSMAWPNLVSLSTSSRNRRRPRRHGRWELASAHCCATEGIRASPCAPSLFPYNPSTPVPLARFSPPRVRPRPKTQSPPPHRCRGHRASRGLKPSQETRRARLLRLQPPVRVGAPSNFGIEPSSPPQPSPPSIRSTEPPPSSPLHNYRAR